ncbi:MAG: murein biosynthesis integral membrane protein MurJ [Clostridium sp.]
MFMVNKIKSSENMKEVFKLLIMMCLTIFTQGILLMKAGISASIFGVSQEMDAFNFANSIGTFIYSFIGAGVTTVLIPNLVNKKKKESINIFISVLYSTGFLILIFVTLMRKSLVSTLSNGDDVFIMITCNIMIITLITQYINSISGITNAIFQCKGKFNFPKFITAITSIVLVLLVITDKNLTINKYAIYILITTILNIILQIYLVIKDGYEFKYKIDLKDKEFKRMFKIFGPTALSTGLYQISLLIDSIISTNLEAGAISKLSYSNNIMALLNSVILANIMVYFYPKIAKNIKAENGQRKLFELSLLVNAVMIFIVVVFIVVGKEGISILYERGAFLPSTTMVVYTCTMIYIIGLPTNAFRDLIYRYFYAKGDTMTPFKNSLIISCLNILISIGLSRIIGIYGIIWGTVVTSYMSLFMILYRLEKKYKIDYSKKILIKENLKLILSGCITVIIVWMIKDMIPVMDTLSTCIIFGTIAIIIYCLIVFLIKSTILKIRLSEY